MKSEVLAVIVVLPLVWLVVLISYHFSSEFPHSDFHKDLLQTHLISKVSTSPKILPTNVDIEQEILSKTIPPYPSTRFLTFEHYPGRFGNQMYQFDWAYRLAFATNRTLAIVKPTTKEFYIGMPDSWEEAEAEYMLWDLPLLRSGPVAFHFAHDKAPIPDLEATPKECQWAEEKFIVSWVMSRTHLPACQGRIHFASNRGFINLYRSDTRELGVDPLLFWRNWRFRPEIFALAQAQLNLLLGNKTRPSVGVHVRTFREANSKQDKVTRLYASGQRNMPLDIALALNKRKACGCEAIRYDTSLLASPEPVLWDGTHVNKMYPLLALNLTTDMTIKRTLALLMRREEEEMTREGFLVATDHNDPEVARVIASYGGRIMDLNGLIPISFPGVPGVKEEYVKFSRTIEGLMLDLAAMILVDEFVGVPLSSLTQAVCMWRISFGKEKDPMCELLYMKSYSWRCSELRCGAGDFGCCGK